MAKWMKVQTTLAPVDQEYWKMYFYVSLVLNDVGASIVLISHKGERIKYILQLHLKGAMNNIDKYEALLHGLQTTICLGIHCLYVHGNSKIVVNQMMKDLLYKDRKMEAYSEEVRKLEHKFDVIELHHVLRCDNDMEGTLAKLGFVQD